MFDNKKQREDPEVGGAGMADIAFLLLIFFLLVTTINTDTGINLVLPPPQKKNQPPPQIKDRNLLKVLVNAEGSVLLDDKPTPLSQVKKNVMKFINNKGKDPHLSEAPDKAVVSIKTDRQTKYETYIDMLDKVIGAYAQLRNQAAQKKYGQTYGSLGDGGERQNVIQEMYPKKISIAEPNK